MKWTKDIVRVCWDGDVKRAVMFQNGSMEVYRLVKATNDHVDELLEVDNKEEK